MNVMWCISYDEYPFSHGGWALRWGLWQIPIPTLTVRIWYRLKYRKSLPAFAPKSAEEQK